MTKYIYGIGGQKSRAARNPILPAGINHVETQRPATLKQHTPGWTPRWWQVRGAFLWALAGALAALVAL